MVITHEPPFWLGNDDVRNFTNDPVYKKHCNSSTTTTSASGDFTITMRLFGLLWIDEDRGDSRAADNSSDFGAGADCETAGLSKERHLQPAPSNGKSDSIPQNVAGSEVATACNPFPCNNGLPRDGVEPRPPSRHRGRCRKRADCSIGGAPVARPSPSRRCRRSRPGHQHGNR